MDLTEMRERLLDTLGHPLESEVEELLTELERLQEVERRYQQLSGALTAAWPGISAMIATTWTAIQAALPGPHFPAGKVRAASTGARVEVDWDGATRMYNVNGDETARH
jgi:hypothetical protein